MHVSKCKYTRTFDIKVHLLPDNYIGSTFNTKCVKIFTLIMFVWVTFTFNKVFFFFICYLNFCLNMTVGYFEQHCQKKEMIQKIKDVKCFSVILSWFEVWKLWLHIFICTTYLACITCFFFPFFFLFLSVFILTDICNCFFCVSVMRAKWMNSCKVQHLT